MALKESRRAQIVDQALGRAVQVGLQGLTIGQLARELGMSKSGLISHFRSKEGLQEAIVLRAAELFVAGAIRPALGAAKGEPRLRSLFEHWMHWLTNNPFEHGCFFIAAASEMDDQPGPIRDQLVSLERQFLGHLADMVQDGVDRGHFESGIDTELVAHQIHAIFLDHNFSRRLLDQDDIDDRAQRWFEQILEGCRPRK